MVVYIKNAIKSYKLKNDIIDTEPSFKHLWLEIKGKSNKQSCLLGVLCQSNFDMSAREELLQNLIDYFSKSLQHGHCYGRFQHKLDETK